MSRRVLLPASLIAGWMLLPGFGAGLALAQWTLVGTAVTPDGRAGVSDVTITLHPDSTVRTITDLDGDFFIPWDGARGWISLVAAEPGPDGKPWCKRRVFKAATPGTPQGMVDLGKIIVSPRTRFAYQTIPAPPRDARRPARLRLPGPAGDEADTCRFRIRYQADLWGHATTVGDMEHADAPAPLREAVLDWVRQVAWTVPDETICGTMEPYAAFDEVYYAWSDSVWVLLDKTEMHRIEVRRRAQERKSEVTR